MTEKILTIVEKLKELTLLEVVDLIKQLEETFDIDPTAMVASLPMVSGVSSAPVASSLEVIEEKASFDVVLSEVPGDKKIAILKIVRNLTGLGLKESKDIVDNVPKTLKEGVSKQESESIKKELEAAGAKVLLK